MIDGRETPNHLLKSLKVTESYSEKVDSTDLLWQQGTKKCKTQIQFDHSQSIRPLKIHFLFHSPLLVRI